jgi:hypothetical protein
MGGACLPVREHGFFLNPLPRLVAERIKDSDNGAIGRYNSNRQHSNHGKTKDANA